MRPAAINNFVLVSSLPSMPMPFSIRASHFAFLPHLHLAGFGFGVISPAYRTVLILRQIFRVGEITGDVVHGDLVLYLLRGIPQGFVMTGPDLMPEPRKQPEKPADSRAVILNIFDGVAVLREIWRVRQDLMVTLGNRRPTQRNSGKTEPVR